MPDLPADLRRGAAATALTALMALTAPSQPRRGSMSPVRRPEEVGGTRVESHSPYRGEHGATTADPGGYRSVLRSRARGA
nr:hypothetical protein KitaXyl93_58520 [Kitasatospora sp. Xyl93]